MVALTLFPKGLSAFVSLRYLWGLLEPVSHLSLPNTFLWNSISSLVIYRLFGPLWWEVEPVRYLNKALALLLACVISFCIKIPEQESYTLYCYWVLLYRVAHSTGKTGENYLKVLPAVWHCGWMEAVLLLKKVHSACNFCTQYTGEFLK